MYMIVPVRQGGGRSALRWCGGYRTDTMSGPRSTEPGSLRARAEAASPGRRPDGDRLSLDDMQRLVHELEVHEIELELQNEELLRAQIELAASRDRLTDFYDFAPIGLLTLAHDATVRQANLTVAAMLGLDRQALIGRAFTGFVDPADQNLLYFHRRAALASATPQSCEIRLRRHDGNTIWVRLNTVCPGDPADHERSCRVAITDWTERHSEQAGASLLAERLQRLVESSPVAIYAARAVPPHDSIYISENVERVLGFSAADMTTREGLWEERLHPDDAPAVREAMQRLFKSGGQVIEYRWLHRDGTYRWIRDDCRFLPGVGGTPAQIVGTFGDFTERKQAREERDRGDVLRRMVTAQEEERQRIGRELHDLIGQRMTSLRLHLEPLAGAAAALPELAGRIEAVTDNLRQLDNDLDKVVRELRPAALDDLGLQAALTQHVHDWSRQFGLPVRLHAAGLVDDRLHADVEGALYRIAQESLTNIAKHARATQVDIVLERRDGVVSLIIEDDGVGFDPGQLYPHRLGLKGMRERAALIGATIEIDSSPGNGTSVLVRGSERRPGEEPHA